MLLEGSCHCEAVTFSLESSSYCPYQLCYCTICVKGNGSSGAGINLGGDRATLKVQGEEHVAKYHPRISERGAAEKKFCKAERAFCKLCGSHLWQFDPRWPELVHPYASAIDTELPKPPERTHLMLKYKPSWVEPSIGPNDLQFEEYPKESLAQWHERHGFK